MDIKNVNLDKLIDSEKKLNPDKVFLSESEILMRKFGLTKKTFTKKRKRKIK